MTSLLLLRPSGPELPSWLCDAVPYAYEEAGRVQLQAIPGVRWVADRASPNGRGFYRGPRDAVEIAAHTLEAAGVCKLRRELPPELAGMLPELAPWPLGLRSYQVDGAAWCAATLRATGGALLADDMGIGKTVQAVVTASALGVASVLVACPASVVGHWQRTAAAWDPGGRAWEVMSYERLLRAKAPPTAELFVVDEVHAYSNPKAKRTQAALRARAGARYALALSGTPMLASPSDLWQPLELLHPGRWGSRWQFQNRYCDGAFTEIPMGGGETRRVWTAQGCSRAPELAQRLRHVMLRRTKREVASELPALVRTVHEVELPAAARKAARAATRAIDWRSQGRHGVQSLLSGVEHYKLEAAVEVASELRAQGHRVLLLTTHKETARELGARLCCPWVHGDVAPDERVAQLAQQGNSCGVATVYSVGTGVDGLQRHFDALVFVGLDWLPNVSLQAEARLQRIGAEGAAIPVVYLVGLGTVDEVVRERVIERLDQFDAVIGAGDAGMREALGGGSEEDLIAAVIAAVKGSK